MKQNKTEQHQSIKPITKRQIIKYLNFNKSENRSIFFKIQAAMLPKNSYAGLARVAAVASVVPKGVAVFFIIRIASLFLVAAALIEYFISNLFELVTIKE